MRSPLVAQHDIRIIFPKLAKWPAIRVFKSANNLLVGSLVTKIESGPFLDDILILQNFY